MSWAYNQIDVRISQYENVLGDTNPEAITWEALSRYSIVRGRPSIQPSSVDASQLSIPGRMGKPYSLIAGRSNAVLSFELLVADAWPFKALRQNEELDTVEKRAEYLKAKLMYAKRVCFKEPGRNWDWFFEIYKVDVTESDADEKVSVLQIKMEVYPFKFDFSGNAGIVVPANGSVYLTSFAKNYPCNPVYKIEGNKAGTITLSENSGNGIVWFSTVKVAAQTGVIYPIYIDTERLLVYGTTNFNDIQNRTRYTEGDISGLRVKRLSSTSNTITFTNNSQNTVTIYPRSGKIV